MVKLEQLSSSDEAKEARWRVGGEKLDARVVWESERVKGPGKGGTAGQQERPLGVCGHALNERPPLHGCACLQLSTAGAHWHGAGRELGVTKVGVFATFVSPGSQVCGVELEQYCPLSRATEWQVADHGTSQPGNCMS